MGVGAAAGRGGGGGARWAKRPREAGGVRRAAGGVGRAAARGSGCGVWTSECAPVRRRGALAAELPAPSHGASEPAWGRGKQWGAQSGSGEAGRGAHAHATVGLGPLGIRTGVWGRARRRRGPRTRHCRASSACLQPPPGTARSSSPRGRRRGAGAAARPGPQHSRTDSEGVAGLGLLLARACSSRGVARRPRPWAFPRFCAALVGVSVATRGAPGARLGPPEGSGAEGRGVCVNVAHSLFPRPRPRPGCWRGSFAVRRRL